MVYKPSRRSHRSPLLLLDLWHLLSLDAPSVAVTWLIFVGACTGLRTVPMAAVSLFVTVWIVYAADRLLDADALPRLKRLAAPTADLALRHHFHRRHRLVFYGAMALLLPVLGWMLPRLPLRTLAPEAALALLLAGWLLRVHRPAISTPSRPLPKEFAVGFFFALAIFLPSAALLPSAPRIENALILLPSALLFAGVCTLNCLFLYAWEHPQDLSRAHPATAFAVRRLVPFACCGLAGAAVVWAAERSTPLAPLALASCLSTLLLLVLHANRHRVQPLRLRALADVVLLTPAPLALLHRVPWYGLQGHL